MYFDVDIFLLWQREHVQRLVVALSVRCRDDGDVLLAAPAHVRDRNRRDVVVETNGPEFLTGPGLEGAEVPVARRADEHQSTGGDDRAAVSWRADLLPAFGHAVVDTQRHAPGELACCRIHSHQAGPRRTETRQRAERSPARVTGFGAERAAVLLHVWKFGVLRLLVVARIRGNPAGGRL